MTAFNFDEATHIYTVDGIVYPSVTTVIEAAALVDYGMIPASDLQFYQDRGTALHQACWFSDEGDLKEGTVDTQVVPRLEAWRRFRRELPFTVLSSERRMFERKYGFAGTPDRLVKFPDGNRAIVELKSGPIQPAAAVQTAAQLRLVEANGERLATKRYAVHLRDDSRYSVQEFHYSEYLDDLSVFLSALAIYKWRQKNT